MENKRTIISLAMMLLFIVLVFYIKRWIDIDKCLDRGGRWNDETCECEGSREFKK
jgi:hypothetical protein